MAWGEVRGGRSLDRLIGFSDAVVAVAVTILALPLVDIEGPQNGETMWDVLVAHAGQIQTFFITFLVVAILWNVHNRIVNSLAYFDTAIFYLVVLWLMGFVFLPWPSTLYTAAGFDPEEAMSHDVSGAGVLYWMTLAYIAFIGALTARHMDRHPELIAADSVAYMAALHASRARYRGLAFTTTFVIAAIATYFVYWLGNYFLLLLIPISIYLRPPRHDPEQAAPEGDAG